MSEGEVPERPKGILTTEQHGLSREKERGNPFAAEIAGQKPPYSYEVFDRVGDKLVRMMDDYPWKNWFYTELHEDDRADVRMIYQGFQTVAYDRIGGTRKAMLQDQFYEAATGDIEGDFALFSPEDFTDNSRIYDDRFELTFRQAKAVQKIMRYLAEDYDPGGPENTPDNITKRTFYYDNYLGRPIPKDHPEQTLTAQPEHDQKIRDYGAVKKQQPGKRLTGRWTRYGAKSGTGGDASGRNQTGVSKIPCW